jgi:hypothetical protein
MVHVLAFFALRLQASEIAKLFRRCAVCGWHVHLVLPVELFSRQRRTARARLLQFPFAARIQFTSAAKRASRPEYLISLILYKFRFTFLCGGIQQHRACGSSGRQLAEADFDENL